MLLFSLMSEWSVWNYITAILDIAILTYVIYKIVMVLRGTRAVQLIRGLVMLVIAAVLATLLQLTAVSWIMNQFWTVLFVALAVVFQPELRRMLERLGRKGSLGPSVYLSSGDLTQLIEEVVGAAVACAKTRTGALIVLERQTGLNDVIETGLRIDSQVSKEMLCNIFVPNTPLHDGAAIISGGRVAAAACFLPLTDNPYISLALGTRHRAAIGLSEISDAVTVIVSEETGAVSVAQEGKLIRNLDDKHLRALLSSELSVAAGESRTNQRAEESRAAKAAAKAAKAAKSAVQKNDVQADAQMQAQAEDVEPQVQAEAQTEAKAEQEGAADGTKQQD